MIESLFSMQDKICVVTGGNCRLSSFMAQGLLEAGAKRVYITARKRDVGVAIMLASQADAFITGQIIPIDGGTSVVN